MPSRLGGCVRHLRARRGGSAGYRLDSGYRNHLNIMSVAVGVTVALPRLGDADWKVVGMTACGLIPTMVLGVLALRY